MILIKKGGKWVALYGNTSTIFNDRHVYKIGNGIETGYLVTYKI